MHRLALAPSTTAQCSGLKQKPRAKSKASTEQPSRNNAEEPPSKRRRLRKKIASDSESDEDPEHDAE